VHGRAELHDDVRAEIEIVRLSSTQRSGDHPVKLLAILDAKREADTRDDVEIHDLREIESRRARHAGKHAILDVLANAAFVEVEQPDDLSGVPRVCEARRQVARERLP
jgi:hypothetical protein